MEKIKTINNEKIITVEDMINAEIDKIKADGMNEQNLLKLCFLDDVMNEIAQEWKRYNSSREREDSQYIWRAVNNEANWLKTILFESKLKAIYNNISTIKNTRRVISPDEPLAQKLEEFETKKNEVQEEYVDGLVDYNRICRERELFNREGLCDERVKFSSTEILNEVEKYNDAEKIKFWHKYFILADKFIEPELSNSKEMTAVQMGE